MNKVLKFGGTSVGSAERIRDVVRIVRAATKHDSAVVVVSALSGVTDQLLETSRLAARGRTQYTRLIEAMLTRHSAVAQELLTGAPLQRARLYNEKLFGELASMCQGIFLVRECSPRSLDLVMSFGERLSAYLIAQAMLEAGVEAEYLDARALMRTDAHFGSAHVETATTYRAIRRYFAKHPALQIVTGFIGATVHGETTTLGRGGSDYTATLLGAALEVAVVEIWTDVDGVMTADPRRVPSARLVDRLRYSEAAELSHFGAKVIYPPTIRPAWEGGIPIQIKNTARPRAAGTVINSQPRKTSLPITGVASIPNVGLLQVQGAGLSGSVGTAGRLFTALAHAGVNVILISQASSEYSVCVAMLEQDLDRAQRSVEAEFVHELRTGQIEAVEIERNRAIIAVVGERMRHTPGTAGQIFAALGEHGINVVAIAQGSSELNISIVIDRKDEVGALNVIHDTFFPKGK